MGGVSVLRLGHRDEEVFDDLFRFDVGRDPNKHLAFGYGVHFCLGAALARMEVSSFFTELLPRLKSIELNGNPELIATTFVGGLKHLPIRYELRWATGSAPAARAESRPPRLARIPGSRSRAGSTAGPTPPARSAVQSPVCGRCRQARRPQGYRRWHRTAPHTAGRCARAVC